MPNFIDGLIKGLHQVAIFVESILFEEKRYIVACRDKREIEWLGMNNDH